MKKISFKIYMYFALLISSALVLFLFTNATTTTTTASQISNSGLRYFTYYGSAGWNDDLSDKLADHINLSWIVGLPGPDFASGIINKAKNAKAHKLQALVDVGHIFFNDNDFCLRADSSQRWIQFSQDIKDLVYDGTIIGFYPLDEPYAGEKLCNNKISIKERKQELENIGFKIKQTFSQTIVSTVFNVGTMIDKDFAVPVGYDWIGFDYYGCWNDCSINPATAGWSWTSWYQLLKSKLDKNQKIILFLDAHTEPYSDPKLNPRSALSNNANSILTDRIKNVLDLTLKDSQIIGLFPFIYQNLKYPEMSGAESLPDVLTLLKSIGSQIKKIPAVSNAGMGCEDMNCIWLSGSGFGSKIRLDIRRTSDYALVSSISEISGISEKGLGINRTNPNITTVTYRLPSQLISDFQQKGFFFYVVNSNEGTWSLPIKLQKPVPKVNNAGIGCQDKQCLWLIGNNFAPDAYVDIRDINYTLIERIPTNLIRREIKNSGETGFTLRIVNPTSIKALRSNGLRIYVVNPSWSNWSDGTIVK